MDTSSQAGKPDSALKVLIPALRRVLRPLVRLLLAKGITYIDLIEHLKRVYVEVAARDFTLDDKQQTVSRISLLTGIHRKDVKRLSELEHDAAETPSSISLGAQLVNVWTTSPQYLDKLGKAVPLPRLASGGEPKSFEGLVESVSKDIRSRAVLDEWLRLGVVYLDDNDRVCLSADAFIPKKGFEEKVFYFGRNLSDHVAAASHNLMDGDPPLLERSVRYDGLTTASIEELEQLSGKEGMNTLLKINKRAMELQTRDKGDAGARGRINLGLYFYKGDGDDAADEGDDS